jgi:hypothetical protein
LWSPLVVALTDRPDSVVCLVEHLLDSVQVTLSGCLERHRARQQQRERFAGLSQQEFVEEIVTAMFNTERRAPR